MPQRNSWRGRMKGATDVNIIDPGVSYSSRRRAKLGFTVTLLTGWVLATVIAWQLVPATVLGVTSPTFSHIVAIVIGLFLALAAAVVVWFCLIIWPPVRKMIHWCREIALATGLLIGFSCLCTIMPVWEAGLVTTGGVGGLFVYPPLRGFINAHICCLVAMHRVRTAFADFLRGNRSGSLPLILHSWPTPVGVRVWTWLRPGLCLSELEGRGEQLAVTCWASNVTVVAANRRFAALVRFDIKYRDTFGAQVAAKLQDYIPEKFKNRSTPAIDGELPKKLDLPDVTATDVTNTAEKNQPKKDADKPRKDSSAPAKPDTESTNPVADWFDDTDFGTGNADYA